jgi:basic amino acid/polyamine antiporter, APA family
MNAPPNGEAQLDRGLSLSSATALNMIDMIGVGPFITIPLIVGAMGGPQAMLGWVLGAIFALFDGMVWAELGASMPRAGGSYRYLREIYGFNKLGRLLSFLFIWQLSFSAPLSIASGCIGLAKYATFFWPSLQHTFFATDVHIADSYFAVGLRTETLLGIAIVALAAWLGYRRIADVGKISKLLWITVIGTIAWVIFAGVTHFDAHRAFDFPPGAFTPNSSFFSGLAMAMLFATYDYWGYYNVAFLGEEVQEPAKNIPKAIRNSILMVGGIYIVMNISVLGVVPWRELMETSKSDARLYVIASFMERLYGHTAAGIVTVLVMITAFASVFSLLLGYSRVPFAAARDGNYFRAFGKIHPKLRIPHVSLIALASVAALCCLFTLQELIASLVIIRIMMQFIVQAIGLIYLRSTRPDMSRPYRMWLYPMPAILAIGGFLFMLSTRVFLKQVAYGTVLVVVGTLIYLWRAWRDREWPFVSAQREA